MIKNFNYLIVTFFGIGTLRFAPGTFTSLITTVFLFSLFHIINLSHIVILFFLLIIFFYSFYAVADYIKDNKDKDPKEVTIDEVIGQSIPIYLYEIAHGNDKNPQDSAIIYVCIFILFRLFDIQKPFPINIFDQKFKNSFGVILDDVIAGLYVVLTLIIFMVIKSNFLL